MKIEELVCFEGETLSFDSAKITSVTLADGGGTVNITGQQPDYGLIYLTYHLQINPKIETQGVFHGKALGIGSDGERNTAQLQGVWVRKGRETTLYSLDDVSDGHFYFAVVQLDLENESAEIHFSSLVK